MAGPQSTGTYVTMDAAAISAYMRSPTGGVLRDLNRRGTNVQRVARDRVRKRTHRLERSIVKRMVRHPTGLAVLVGVFDPEALRYALIEEAGSRPHVIAARTAPRLVFYWPKVGRVVSFPQVNHPGTEGSHFLTVALEAARR